MTLVAPDTLTTDAVFAPSASATRAVSTPGSSAVDAVIAPAASSAGAMVDPLSASSTCERPAPSPADDQEDDRLSQLFPDENHSVSDDDVVLEDASADPPGLEPLSEQEEGHARAQTAAWWKDKPLDKVPMVEVPFFVPLTDKSSQTVLQGLMRIHTEVKALGLPLVRLHSDRGREFINRKVTTWTLYHGIVQTSTSGDDWKANGRTENWVRLLKRSTRTLLAAHGALPSQWAFAMRHCAARLQAAALSMIGVPQPRLLPWNASLALRRRSWETKQPWAERVTRARVLCPSPVLRGGHLVRTLDGSFVHTEALVEVAGVVELRAYEPPKPSTRLRGKQPLAVAVVSSSVSPSFFDAPRTCFAVPQRGGEQEQEQQQVYFSRPTELGGETVDVLPTAQTSDAGATSPSKYGPSPASNGILAKEKGLRQPKKVRFDVPARQESEVKLPKALDIPQSEAVAHALDGLPQVPAASLLELLQVPGAHLAVDAQVAERDFWTYGVCTEDKDPAITLATKTRPCLTRLLCKVVKACNPDLFFASMRVTCNQGRRCLQDVDCAEGSRRLLIPLSPFQGGQMWIEDEGAIGPEVVFRSVLGDPEGHLRRGKIFPVWPSLTFDASRFHEVQEFQGDRWMLEAFTPRSCHRLLPDQCEHLTALGFSLPHVASTSLLMPAVRMLAFGTNSSGGLDGPAYECVGAAQVLDRCRASVMKAMDCAQSNLKKWSNQVMAFWGLANAQGEGEVPAAVLRDTELQVCNLQNALEVARAREEEECPPLLPTDQEKELATLYPDPSPEPRVCVAHAQKDSLFLGRSTKRGSPPNPDPDSGGGFVGVGNLEA